MRSLRREEETMSHPVVWFEVMGKDGAGLQRFYAQLFGWRIDASNPTKYGLVEAAQGRGIPGGVGQLGDQPWPKVTFYVSTTDIAGSLGEAARLGGRTLMPRTELPGGTILGFLADPEGNTIGLVEEPA
jgi:predicted enzyme related to lactoylglutathione lyase